MIDRLEAVITNCVSEYGLELNGVNGRKRVRYMEFLKRQQEKHHYGLLEEGLGRRNRVIYLNINLLADKLMLFAYLIGEEEIISGYGNVMSKRRVMSIRDLYLLRPSELGVHLRKIKKDKRATRRTDWVLHKLYRRFANGNYRFPDKWPGWTEVLNDLGEDRDVIRHFKMVITADKVYNCSSPNPHTTNYREPPAVKGRKKKK